MDSAEGIIVEWQRGGFIWWSCEVKDSGLEGRKRLCRDD